MTYTIQNSMNHKGIDFTTVKDENGFFWTIESKYIVNGRLTKNFNGISGCYHETESGSVRQAKINAEAKIWQDANPNATDVEFMKALAQIVINLQ